MSSWLRRLSPLFVTAIVAVVAACLPDELLRVRVSTLDDELTFVRGGGGNSLVLIKGGRALVFDSKRWPFDGELLRVVQASGARATWLVNAHVHGDHIGGNRLFPEAAVVAVPSTLELLRGTRGFDGSGWMAVRERTSLSFAGERIELGRLPPSHTSSDLYGYFSKRRLLATGDVFVAPFFPLVDRAEGGSYLGVIKALDLLCEIDADMVVPGHGPAAGRAELLAYRDFFRGCVTR